MPDLNFPRPLGVPCGNDAHYDGTDDELDRQMRHGQAQLDVIRAARRYLSAADNPRVDIGRAYLNLAHALASLDTLEGR